MSFAARLSDNQAGDLEIREWQELSLGPVHIVGERGVERAVDLYDT